MIRHARLTHAGSSGASPSSKGTSTTTQPSLRSHHSHHSHQSHASRHASRRDGSHHGSRHGSHHSHHRAHCSRHRSRCRGIPIPCAVQKFKRGGPIPIKIWIQQMEYYFSLTGVPERKHVKGMINHFDPMKFKKCSPIRPTIALNSARKSSGFSKLRIDHM